MHPYLRRYLLRRAINKQDQLGSVEIQNHHYSANCEWIDLPQFSVTLILPSKKPELISGSLRENLDPFQEHDDLTLNDALKSAGLQTLQEDMSEKDKIKLDTMVSSGGSNFSLGQRQIIALARAIVRRSKLLILDEGVYQAPAPHIL